MGSVRPAIFAAALAAAGLGAAIAALAEEPDPTARIALVADIDGAIGPATARYMKEALASAAERQAEVLVLRLNTPGGLVSSMREIIADILASPVPVVGYVAPSGGHAASAGTYILYATHIAAMAPGTNIGAATPVELGGPLPSLPGGEPAKDENEGKDQKPSAPAPADAMTAKVTNDAVAFIRSLAELRGRNADWAEKAVRDAATLSANGALKERVIELVVPDMTGLLDRIDGMKVQPASGERILRTKGLAVETIEPGWLNRLLAIITDPNIAIILMLIGVYGLIFEFTSPGAVAPGITGVICLLVGLYALNLLPIDYAGLALMLLGIGLLIAEVFNPTVVLGIGGATAFLLGAAMLFKTDVPGYQLSWVALGSAAALSLGLALLAGSYVWASRKNPPRVGTQAMRGLPAEILDWSGAEGHAMADGERWRARGDGAFTPGERVEVTGVEDLTLLVRRRSANSSDGEGQ